MPGSNAEEAANYFHAHFSQSLAIITQEYLQGIPDGSDRVLLFETPAAVALKGGNTLYIDVVQTFTIVEVADQNFRAKTTGYSYSLLESPEDSGEYGILSYHWHPERTPQLRWPHLHAVPRQEDSYLNHRIHLPTSRICIEDFVHVLIRDFKAQTRVPYEEWKKTIVTNKTSFAKYANWWAYALNTPVESN